MIVGAVREWLREDCGAAVELSSDGVRGRRREEIEFENASVAPAGEIGERAAAGVGGHFGTEEDGLWAEVGENLGPEGTEEHAVGDDGDGERVGHRRRGSGE